MREKFLGGYTKAWWDRASKNRVLVRKYNTINPLNLRGKYKILSQLLDEVGPEAIIEPPFYCDEGKNIRVGKGFYANYNLVILDAEKVTIGDYVLMGPNVTLCGAAHPIHPLSRNQNGKFPITRAPITIGDNVWIGANVTITMGVTIGQNTTIAAGAVVTRDIPADCVAGGVPCRVIRAITESDRYDWSNAERQKMGF